MTANALHSYSPAELARLKKFRAAVVDFKELIAALPPEYRSVDHNRQFNELWSEGQALLEGLLRNYNEGRSMSLYCKACARMSIDSIKEAIERAKEKLEGEKVDISDMKLKARILRAVIKDIALTVNINLD